VIKRSLAFAFLFLLGCGSDSGDSVFIGSVYAADQNGYTALYECRSGGPNCNVDVVTKVNLPCDTTINTGTAWSNVNSATDSNLDGTVVICVVNGDHTGKGALTLTSSGTSSVWRVLRYYRASDNNDEPWNQSSANKADILRVNLNGSDYWIIHRISFTERTSWSSGDYRIAFNSSESSNIIINRVLLEGCQIGGSCLIYGAIGDETGGSFNTVTLQNSVMRNSNYGATHDGVGIGPQNGSDVRVVNNEMYDWSSHLMQPGENGTPTVPGVIAENNDMYYTSAMDGFSEGQIDIKALGTSGNPHRYIQNRFWGSRPGDDGVCCIGGGGGHAIALIGTPTTNVYHLFQNNIFLNNKRGIVYASGTLTNGSVIGNIFYDHQRFGGGSELSQALDVSKANTTEVYLNTIIKSDDTHTVVGGSGSDYRCNVYIDSANGTGSLGSGSQRDYQVYYGTTDSGETNKVTKTLNTRANSTSYSQGAVVRTTATPPANGTAGDFLYMKIDSGTESSGGSAPTWCTTLGCTVTDGDVTWQAIRGPYSFYRKLRTGPEQVYIPYAKAHTSATEIGFCPSGFASRTGIGIDDDKP